MAAIYGKRSSIGRASGCGSEGRGFDPRRLPHFYYKIKNMDIIILAAIAVYIFFKLHNQFGKIDDDQKRNVIKNFVKEQASISSVVNSKIIQPIKENKSDNKSDNKGAATIAIDNNFPEIDKKSQKILETIADDVRNDLLVVMQKANLSIAGFVNGAINAFEMVIEAFAIGDIKKLQLLLSEKILQQFIIAIEQRKNLDQILGTKIIAIDESKITAAKFLHDSALITVRFLSRQINYITDSSGKMIGGSTDQINSIEDIWIFHKDCLNSNPNWTIISTSSTSSK